MIAVIGGQRERLADLEQEVACLRGELTTQQAEMTRLTERVGAPLAALAGPEGDDRSPRPTTMPGLKPAGTRRARLLLPSPRTHRAQGYGRKRMRPTAQQVHALPTVRTAARRCAVAPCRRTREVIELAPAR